MEKSTLKISKSNTPTSLSIDHGMFKSYSILSRCNSFSSSSNDSAVYCGTHSTQTKLKNGKRLASDNQSVDLPKRTRNSSGSSISSNMSCVSDKDLKSSNGLSHTTKSPTKNNAVNNVSPPLEYPNKSNGEELREEKSESIPRSKKPVIVPNQRILRRNITKKGCACCPTTRTTVVVRRYQEIFKTSESGTVISSTKVKTYVQKGSVPTVALQSIQGSNKSSTKSGTAKKRKSEIEKLYESLHEIEWAKNFSPDNILRQINVRQAASCSVFGRSPTSTENLPEKISKRTKSVNLDNVVSSPLNKSSKSVNRISKRRASIDTVEPIVNRQRCDNKVMVSGLQTKQITSNTRVYEPSYKSCNSQSSVNITCSVSCINLKEININPTESIHHAESLLAPNNRDCDDAQLSYTSDESSSVSSSIVNLQSKHLLDLDYNDRTNKDMSDADVSEFSAPPKFFDIAEEGIRTIDACFREVGAEVVVSTCYDESSLPSLTSVRENGTLNKVLVDDGPPVLEPCIPVTSDRNSVDVCNDRLQIKAKMKIKNSEDCSKTIHAQNGNNCDSLHFELDQNNAKNIVETQESKKGYSYLIYRSNRDLLLIKARKRILKKYWKLLNSRCFFKLVPKIESNETSCEHADISNGSNSHVEDVKSCGAQKDNKSLLNNYQNSTSSSLVSLPSSEINSKTNDRPSNNEITSETPKEMCSTGNLKDRLIVDYIKNGSSLYGSVKVLKHTEETKTFVTPKIQTAVPEQKPIISSFKTITTKVEDNSEISREKICHLLPSFGFSCQYNCIKVNRSNNYTQIILKITRGKSIFLTIEALTELKDVLNRTSHDTGCQVLVLNGIGDSFCLGVDIKQLVGPRKKIATVEMANAVKGLIEALSELKKPVAAVVNGPALGLGMTLLNHADISIASEKATFCMPHSFLGYMPEGGATLTLPQIVGSTMAMDLLLRGRTLTAREACNVGLISEVVEAKRLPHELVSRVRMLAGSSLSALETTKALLKMQLHVNLKLVLENEVKLLPCMWLNQACQDAMRKALHSGILSE